MTPDPIAALIQTWRDEYRVAIERDIVDGLRETTTELGGKVTAADELEPLLAALRQQREAGQQEARQQVGEGLFTAKYLNPGCAEKGCQFLQREAGQPQCSYVAPPGTMLARQRCALAAGHDGAHKFDWFTSSARAPFDPEPCQCGQARIAMNACPTCDRELVLAALDGRLEHDSEPLGDPLRAEAQPEQEKP